MRNVHVWIIALIVMLAIFWLSNIPHLSLYDSSSLSLEMKRFIKKYTFRIGNKGFFSYVISPHPDFILHKIGHIFAFGSLGVLLYTATQSIHWAVIITTIFAASDELHQYFVAGRSSRFGDILLDTVAAFVFICIYLRIKRPGKKKTLSESNRDQ